MSLSNILQNVKKKGQFPSRPTQSDKTKITQASCAGNNGSSNTYTYKDGSTKTVDPVVARLKEKRRLEKEKKEKETREKKGLPPKKPKATSKSTSRASGNNGSKTSQRTNISSNIILSPSKDTQRLHQPPTKRMNFNDLMKKASKIDQSKLSISIRPKTKSPEVGSTSQKNRAIPRENATPTTLKPAISEKASKSPTKHVESKPEVRTLLPIRKPSSKLEEKLKLRSKSRSSNTQGGYSKYDDYYDEDEEPFVVSDEEEQGYGEESADYDRDEIWAIFNKGKKRSYYDRYDDYDSADDMEATGAEVLEEEMRSRRRAEIEDRKEMEEEKRLAALKRARKMKMDKNL